MRDIASVAADHLEEVGSAVNNSSTLAEIEGELRARAPSDATARALLTELDKAAGWDLATRGRQLEETLQTASDFLEGAEGGRRWFPWERNKLRLSKSRLSLITRRLDMLQGRNDRAGRLLKEIKRVRGEIKQLEEARQACAGTLAYRGESLAGQKVGSAKAKSAGTETKTIGTEAEAAGTGVKTVGTEAKAFGAEAKLPAGVLPAAAREIAQVAKPSGFRIVGGFLAREAPGLIEGYQKLSSASFRGSPSSC